MKLKPSCANTARILALAMALALSACQSLPASHSLTKTPTPTSTPTTPCPTASTCPVDLHLSGRMSIVTEASTLEPSHAFITQFTLQGNAQTGQLAIQSPTGTTLAEVHWQPGQAQWLQGENSAQYPDMQTLMQNLTSGTSIPLPLLFDWLQGKASVQEGWQVDLSQRAQGLIRAQRLQPPPRVDVRIQLDDGL